MIYMLDTNVCGYIIRDKPENLKKKLKEIDLHHTLALSVIVVSELLYGAKKKNNFKLIKIVSAFIDNFVIMDFDEVSALEYADIRIYLESIGQIIGSNDLFIAAHAKALKAVLVTINVKEFERVPGLNLENWVKR